MISFCQEFLSRMLNGSPNNSNNDPLVSMQQEVKADLMHISADVSFSVSTHTAPDLNKLPNGRAKSQDAPSSVEDKGEDIYGNLHNYIPFGSVTGNLRIEPDGVLDRPVRLAEHRSPFESLVRDLMKSGTVVRVFGRRHPQDNQKGTFRVYVLPIDVGRKFGQPESRYNLPLLKQMLPLLDTSLESWEGRENTSESTQNHTQEQHHDDSLFYIFNTLPSPSPSPADVSCPITKAAMMSLLDTELMPGLKTSLYSYQKRSAAEMVRRETQPLLRLDPRFENIEGPTGRRCYYNKNTGQLLGDKREYEDARGGILAETMGLGKTLICLATILATKGHWPLIPPQYSTNLRPVRPRVGSLMQMAAAAIGHQQIPWRKYFQDLSDAGEHYENCVAVLEENIGSYFIPASKSRGRQKGPALQHQRVSLCSATLVIVPPNLFLQWKTEIALHLKEGALKVLFMESSKTEMPSKVALLSYDIILMTRKRFEQEFDTMKKVKKAKKTKNDNGSSIITQCHTPLNDLHFLRIIADEGHAFASAGRKNHALWALESLRVERRWIISGTPAAGLLGVEVDLATNETSQEQFADSSMSNQSALTARQRNLSTVQERKDLANLGSIVEEFLKVKPWANSWGNDDSSWNKYIMPYPNGQRKPRSLRSILEGLVVRHQIEAVEKDVELPPLNNRVVYLKPSWHDKLSINLFVLTLTANAVTSERVDKDYMFHPRNKKQLDKLITNLRQSGFYWTSFSSQDIGKTLEVSESYLEKPIDPYQANTEDRRLLAQAMDAGRLALESHSWKAFAELSELGIYVEGFPEDACSAWSLVQTGTEGRLLVGATQLIEAQKYVDSRLYFPNPATGLDAFGTTTMEKVWTSAASNSPEEPKLTEKNTKSKAEPSSKAKAPKKPHARHEQATGETDLSRSTTTLKSAMKATSTISAVESRSLDSALAKTNISGTASTKLSYLLDRVVVLQQEEKILIFYEGDQIAYYIAQAFDLMNIGYRIYTGTLSIAQRNEYIDTFNTNQGCRVLLMKTRLAAHGLHLANASRVFFVNPVWQPNVEAQAIKRAHRIGQTRPVYVETLVLKDTLEDKMFQRRKQMTTEEHQTARNSLLDDPIIREIIQNAKPIPFAQDEILEVEKQMAPLETPQRLFGRVYETTSVQRNSNAGVVLSGETGSSNNRQQSRKRKAVGFDTFMVGSASCRQKLQENTSTGEPGDMEISDG